MTQAVARLTWALVVYFAAHAVVVLCTLIAVLGPQWGMLADGFLVDFIRAIGNYGAVLMVIGPVVSVCLMIIGMWRENRLLRYGQLDAVLCVVHWIGIIPAVM